LEGSDDDTPAPLNAEEATALAGTYVFGVADNEPLESDADMKMYEDEAIYTIAATQLEAHRLASRPLFHVAENAFYPAGAPSFEFGSPRKRMGW